MIANILKYLGIRSWRADPNEDKETCPYNGHTWIWYGWWLWIPKKPLDKNYRCQCGELTWQERRNKYG